MTAKKLILVIDDDPDILSSISAVLMAEEFLVETAASAEEGVRKLGSIEPDLILCDMMMEGIDSGIKVAEEIKKRRNTLPIFLLSSIGSATLSNVEIDRLGFDGVFQKPVPPPQLVKTIRRALRM